MNATSESRPIETVSPPTAAMPRRWMRVLRYVALAVFVVILLAAVLLKDHIRTLRSLRRVPGTNAYVMDYYVDYNLEEIRSRGMDVNNVEDSLIDVFFPDVLASIATGAKEWFLDEEVQTIATDVERCSTVSVHSPGGRVFFGRNFDWQHDALLILKIHKAGTVASVSVLDLHYMNLDRDDLEDTNLIQRIPLLFAPYYLQDGMNRHGVAVADMSVDGAKAPYDAAKPDVILATVMRLILDYAESTDEAIEILKQYNIHFAELTEHLMIADATGRSAVVEFVDGRIEVTPTNENWQVCTNHQICGLEEQENDECCVRYRHASEQLARSSATADVDAVMGVMESISKDGWTMWTSVYDLSAGEFSVAYRRHFDKPLRGDLEDR
jgi:hypothetical protein